ncbi:MAG: flagellar basal body P-ring protein FlgI [Polyangiaceae bacterium]|nr:flagellar basal body P-ring protein FlgI [Polyangiaceae bacterium]
MKSFFSYLFVFASVFLAVSEAKAERLGDLTDVIGARENQLIGYGVVTGLNGSGDDIRSRIAEQTLRSMLRRLGIQVDEKRLRLRNVAAVIVTANIAAFSRSGSKLDVTVSSIGNARSLAGGVLLQTPLRGADSQVYAVGQGPLIVGGFNVRGRSGSAFQENITTTARVPGGALVEREIPTQLVRKGSSEGEDSTIAYSLRSPDFVTAQRIALAINQAMNEARAVADDAGAVSLRLPSDFQENPVPLLARLAEVEVTPNQPARVVVNERTGTIVAGGDVRMAPVAIAQGGISVSIYEQSDISQPNPFTRNSGRTVVRPRSDLSIEERESEFRYLDGAATLSDVAAALSALGVTPRELSSILQALRAAGALRAEVVVQ